MSAAPSIISRRTFGHKEHKGNGPERPIVDIRLNDVNGEKTSPDRYIFSTLDRVEGIVSINSPTDMRFDELDIALLGIKPYSSNIYLPHN